MEFIKMSDKGDQFSDQGDQFIDDFVPQSAWNLGFDNWTYYGDQEAAFATCERLSIGVWIRELAPRFTVVKIDDTVAVDLDTYNAPEFELLKTDREEEFRAFVEGKR